MALTKSTKVVAYVQPEIKETAEAVVSQRGITVSVLIDAEFNAMMATGLAQAKADDSYSVEEVFANLRTNCQG